MIIHGIKKVKLSDIDDNKKFFHFTRESYIPKIIEDGLRGDLPVRENAIGKDYENPSIYFSEGEQGLLKTVDMWIRWEYNRITHNNRQPKGDVITIPSALEKTYKRIFEDFKDRRYFQLDLVEGTDKEISDFSHDSEDFKKKGTIDKGGPTHYTKWTLGSYTDWSTAKLEDWNMMTHVGGRNINIDRIRMVVDVKGRSDAISIIKEVYERNKDKNLDIRYLDSFMRYLQEITKYAEKNRSQNIGKDMIAEFDKVDQMHKMEEFIHKEAVELDSVGIE